MLMQVHKRKMCRVKIDVIQSVSTYTWWHIQYISVRDLEQVSIGRTNKIPVNAQTYGGESPVC